MASPISPRLTASDAARMLLARRRARRSMVDFSRFITIPGVPLTDELPCEGGSEGETGGKDTPKQPDLPPVEVEIAVHHVAMMGAIQRCIESDYGRLMIFAPPGSAKSSYACVVGTTWAMGRYPGMSVLMTSYAATPIIRQSRRARQIAASMEYRELFGVGLAIDSKAADAWELANGSSLYAAGLLGGITSSRCGLGIIDDPVAGRAEAQSATIRASTRAAYEDDFLTRLTPKASIILIQTRWHEDDLAGSLLPMRYDGASGFVRCRDGQTWDVLNFPAQCERADDPARRKIGAYLWPEWFSQKHWKIYRKNARTWAALFQQRPSPERGVMFLREYWKTFDETETEIILQRATGPLRVKKSALFVFLIADTALKAKQSNDPSVIGVWGKVPTSGELVLLHLWRDRVESPYLEAILDAMIDVWRPAFVGVEDKASGTQLLQQFRRKGMPLRALKADTDKVSRAQPAVTMAENGMIYLPTSAPWKDDYIEELAAFDAGKHDDQVDMTSYAVIATQYTHLAQSRIVNSTDPTGGMDTAKLRQYRQRRQKRAMITG